MANWFWYGANIYFGSSSVKGLTDLFRFQPYFKHHSENSHKGSFSSVRDTFELRLLGIHISFLNVELLPHGAGQFNMKFYGRFSKWS